MDSQSEYEASHLDDGGGKPRSIEEQDRLNKPDEEPEYDEYDENNNLIVPSLAYQAIDDSQREYETPHWDDGAYEEPDEDIIRPPANNICQYQAPGCTEVARYGKINSKMSQSNIIYAVQPATFEGTDFYKVGMTKQVRPHTRFSEYNKRKDNTVGNCKVIYQRQVLYTDLKTVEDKVIDNLKKEFGDPVKGRETFKGDPILMANIIHDTIKEIDKPPPSPPSPPSSPPPSPPSPPPHKPLPYGENIYTKKEAEKVLKEHGHELNKYIPSSAIVLDPLRLEVLCDFLPNEIVNDIISYDDVYLDISGDMDHVWLSLGIETCNLYQWSWYCLDILQKSVGTTKSSVVFELRDNLFSNLKSLLDDLVCCNYRATVTSIKDAGSNRRVDITGIFYKQSNLIEYPVKGRVAGKKLRKTLSFEDKEYIVKFMERLCAYLNYLEQNVDKLRVNYSDKNYIRQKKKQIIQTIKKMTKKCDRMNQIISELKLVQKEN